LYRYNRKYIDYMDKYIDFETDEGKDEKPLTLFSIMKEKQDKYQLNEINISSTNKYKISKIFSKNRTIIPEVCKNYNIQELLNDTVYIVKNKNILFIDYQVFKMYMVKDIYNLIIQHFIERLTTLLKSYSTFEVHVNLKGLTVSSLQKYSGIFSIFYDTCNIQNIVFSQFITKCCLYNISNSIDAISKIIKQFVDDSVKKTVVFYNERETENILNSICCL
jgi:CRAL/TRIO domain